MFPDAIHSEWRASLTIDETQSEPRAQFDEDIAKILNVSAMSSGLVTMTYRLFKTAMIEKNMMPGKVQEIEDTHHWANWEHISQQDHNEDGNNKVEI